MTGFARTDRFDLWVLFTVLIATTAGVWFGGVISLTSALVWAGFSLGWFIYKQLPKPPKVKKEGKPKPYKSEYQMVCHAVMSKYQWKAINTANKKPKETLAYLRQVYGLEDHIVKWSADCWPDHMNIFGQRKPAGMRVDIPEDQTYIYFFKILNPNPKVEEEAKPTPEPRIISDDERWSRLFNMVPTAFWLDPKLFAPIPRVELYDHYSVTLDNKDIGLLPGDQMRQMAAMSPMQKLALAAGSIGRYS